MLQSHVSNPPEEMVARSGHCYLVLPLLMHLIPTICTSNPLVESLSLQVLFQWRPELFRSFGACIAYTRLRQPVATTISDQKNAAPAKAKTQDVEMSESGDSRSGIRLVSSDATSFEPSTGLSTLQAEDLLKVHGPNELPEKKDPYVSEREIACPVYPELGEPRLSQKLTIPPVVFPYFIFFSDVILP